MSSLEFIKRHVNEWPEGCEVVKLDSYGEILFFGDCGTKHDFYPEGFSGDLYDGKLWNRKEFEACDISGRVSTVNRDIERVSCETIKIKKVDIDQFYVNKYAKVISDKNGNVADVDVYDVLKAFNVICPATQHAVKKLLCSGTRGHKDIATDLREARDSIVRAIELSGNSK
ncbi:hypothetical protein [Candidatus Enterovibrio escicola]|uniref:hypothetical protein n=1 Tax=Candidatus Enterovibrio escicola TaxID=1927127 RepID=UPI001CC31C50|nr:hypothetical protein [Candidatus Enterovibrio escacola]